MVFMNPGFLSLEISASSSWNSRFCNSGCLILIKSKYFSKGTKQEPHWIATSRSPAAQMVVCWAQSWIALGGRSLPHPRLHLLCRDSCTESSDNLTSILDISEGLAQIQSFTCARRSLCRNCHSSTPPPTQSCSPHSLTDAGPQVPLIQLLAW